MDKLQDEETINIGETDIEINKPSWKDLVNFSTFNNLV